MSEELARTPRIPWIMRQFGISAEAQCRVWPQDWKERRLAVAICPLCHGDLLIEPTESRQWFCEGCRASGDPIDLVSHIGGCTRGEAMAWLSGRRKLNWQSKSARQRAIARTRRLEDICADYGLPLIDTEEKPYPWPWRHDGKNLRTSCPHCSGSLLVCIKSMLQVWTCRQCRAGWVDAEDSTGFQLGDSIELVRFLTGCTFSRAVWYLGGDGPRPALR